MKTTAKKILALILVAATLVACTFALSACGEQKKTVYTVGICQLVRHDALDAATQGFKDALVKALGEENVNFIEQNAQNDTNACSTIVTDFVSKNVDLIMANATPSHSLQTQQPLSPFSEPPSPNTALLSELTISAELSAETFPELPTSLPLPNRAI